MKYVSEILNMYQIRDKESILHSLEVIIIDEQGVINYNTNSNDEVMINDFNNIAY